jgi:hypothetical protein
VRRSHHKTRELSEVNGYTIRAVSQYCDKALDKVRLVVAVPEARIVFYQDESGEAPVLKWLRVVLKKARKGYANCIVQIQLLATSGHELR